MEGWIKIHRKIRDNWIWGNPIYFQAWIDLLLMVNHETKKIQVNSQIIEVQPGQRWTSEVQLAKRWQWSRNTVRNFLKLLQNDGMIYRESTSLGTLITVVNYGVYQQKPENGEQRTEQQTEQRTEQREDSALNSTLNTNKNDKNNKNDKRMRRKLGRGGDASERLFE